MFLRFVRSRIDMTSLVHATFGREKITYSIPGSCDFCHDLSPLMEKGRLLNFDHRKGKIFGHSKCLQYSAGLFHEDDSWDSKLVAKELERIKKLICSSCKKIKDKRKLGAGCGCAFNRYPAYTTISSDPS